MLNIQRNHHIDARIQQLRHVLPPLAMPATLRVRVREFVHQHHLGTARQHRVQIHLPQLTAAVEHAPARNPLQPRRHRHRHPPPMRLHQSDHAIDASTDQSVPLRRHLVALPHPRSSAEEHPQPTPFPRTGTGQRKRTLKSHTGHLAHRAAPRLTRLTWRRRPSHPDPGPFSDKSPLHREQSHRSSRTLQVYDAALTELHRRLIGSGDEHGSEQAFPDRGEWEYGAPADGILSVWIKWSRR